MKVHRAVAVAIALLFLHPPSANAQRLQPIGVTTTPSHSAMVAHQAGLNERQVGRGVLWGAAIGGLLGGAVALAEGAEGHTCIDSRPCEFANHSWRDIGFGVGIGALFGLIHDLTGQ